MRTRAVTVFAAGALVSALVLHAQPTEQPQADPYARIKPSAAHSNYEPIVGTWNMDWTLFRADGEDRKVSGTCINTWAVGGRWVKSDFKTDMTIGDEIFQGTGYFGHDNVSGEYHNVWFESNRTAVQYDVGGYDQETRTFTFEGEQSTASGQTISTRTTLHIVSDDEHVIEMYVSRGEDEERKVLELVFEREG